MSKRNNVANKFLVFVTYLAASKMTDESYLQRKRTQIRDIQIGDRN